jgi:hypothetical protein
MMKRINHAARWLLPALALGLAGRAHATSTLLTVNYSNLMARADLVYARAVERSEAGLPIGNGRMGMLVWTTPAAMKFQINRVDVFANNSASDSFPERHTDYCGGCGFVEIESADSAMPIFPTANTAQHLSCYDGLATVTGNGVKTRTLAWNEKDVIAVEVTDERAAPADLRVNLRMLRAPLVTTLQHTATSKLDDRNGQILLTQQFAEGDYYCGSAVAVRVVGRAAKVQRGGAGELRLVTPAGRGTFLVLIASAASFDRGVDLAARALGQLAAVPASGFAGLLESNRTWWREFWSKSFVHLQSADGVAAELERNYTYYLYLMAATSRGTLPTKFNGMLWTTGGDQRQWGGLFWGANQSCLYNNALLAANHPELLTPHFDMISGMMDAGARAAREQWGSRGIFIPETVAFDGLAPLPADIAAEMRALYLLQKPWETVSPRFRDYAATKQPHSSRWNWMSGGRWEAGRWIPAERGGGPYGPVTHIFSRGAKYAYQFWVQYEYTQDQTWLRDRAYPLLKGVAEFYRHYPNVKKGADGRYHIHHVNSNESIWGARDPDEEIAAMRGVFPVAIKAAEILNVDAGLRSEWQEFLTQLAPWPRSDDPAALPSRPTNAAPIWIRGLPPVVQGNPSGRPDGNTMPHWFFDLCTMESDAETFKIGDATLGSTTGRRVGVLSKVPLVAAIMGRADGVRTLIPAQFRTNERGVVLANRMDAREGPQTTSAQRLGNASDALRTALCQDLPAGPGQPSVIRVFPAWPKEWEAEYTLLCRGGFLVTSAMRNGGVEFVEIQSQSGGECRLRNPWGKTEVTFYRDGRRGERVKPDPSGLLRFNTSPRENIVCVRSGDTPQQFQRMVLLTAHPNDARASSNHDN